MASKCDGLGAAVATEAVGLGAGEAPASRGFDVALRPGALVALLRATVAAESGVRLAEPIRVLKGELALVEAAPAGLLGLALLSGAALGVTRRVLGAAEAPASTGLDVALRPSVVASEVKTGALVVPLRAAVVAESEAMLAELTRVFKGELALGELAAVELLGLTLGVLMGAALGVTRRVLGIP